MAEYFLAGAIFGYAFGYGVGYSTMNREPYCVYTREYIKQVDKYARLKNGLLTLALETVFRDKVGTELPIINSVKGYLLRDNHKDIDAFLKKYIKEKPDNIEHLFIKFYIKTISINNNKYINNKTIFDSIPEYDCCET